MSTTDNKKIDDLADILKQHIEDSCVVDEAREAKIDRLMPLADLIPALQDLVQERKTSIAVNERFAAIARMILTIGGVIGAIFAIVQLIFRLGGK